MKYGLALDIDETLSATKVSLMHSFSVKFGNPENLSPEALALKYEDIQSVPYWQGDEAKAWVDQTLNTDSFQENLKVIGNANHIVQKINTIIPIVAYITARPSNVLDGTKKWLDKHGFPQAKIITRPDNIKAEERSIWKAKVLHEMYPHVLGIVDDHHELALHLPKEYKGVLFHYDIEEYLRNDIKVVPCKTWNDVLGAIITYQIKQSEEKSS